MNVVLLDRDGTVIVDPPDYRVNSVSEIELFPDTIEALKYLADNDFSVIFITNQAGIGEGAITEDDFWTIQDEVVRRLEPSGVKILKTYLDGESARPDASDWRKPGPHMLIQAAEDFNLDLSQIYMIGDRETDIEAAIKAGCKGGILVRTATNKVVESAEAVYSAGSLLDAVKYAVSNS